MGIYLFYSSRSDSIANFFPFWFFKNHFFFFLGRFPNLECYLFVLLVQWVFMCWDIEIDRREWAHRGTWYSAIYCCFCVLTSLSVNFQCLNEITFNLALLCSNLNQHPHSADEAQQHSWLLQQAIYGWTFFMATIWIWVEA